MSASSAATVLHADADAFFASVEQRDDPALRGRPVLVGGGVVMACSYEAKARGVHGGMGGARAKRLCPDAVIVSPRFAAYVAASRELFALFERTAPVVEGLSMEEAFLEVRGLERISGSSAEIAARLRHEARERVGLPVTVGVARTRTLAKMASRAAKPDGLLVVEPGRERDFLHPLPIESVWGVGDGTAAKLRAQGVGTVGELAELGEDALVSILGPAAGRHLDAVANNRERRRVRSGRRRSSYGAQCALGRKPRSAAAIDAVLVGLVDRVTRRMRSSRRVGRTVVVRLRFGDYRRATRSASLVRATAASSLVLRLARGLLADARPAIERRGLTLIGIAVTNLEPRGALQLALAVERPDGDAIDGLLDRVRGRFGAEALTRATLLDLGPRLSSWLMPGDAQPDERGGPPPAT